MLCFNQIPNFVFFFFFNRHIPVLKSCREKQRKYVDGHDFTQTHEDTHMAGRRSHTRADNTRPYRSRASLSSSFALESVVARTLL